MTRKNDKIATLLSFHLTEWRCWIQCKNVK